MRTPNAESLPVTIPSLGERSFETACPAVRQLRAGDTLGKLLLTDAMGEGATGKVFRALHQTLNIPVAVKILHSAELERDPTLHHQLRREAQLLAQLNHPNIVRVWDFEDNPDLPYIVLEIVEGLSLADLIDQTGRLSPRHALDLILPVADGLAAAARLGIIHRDVKPANILMSRDRVPKLVDLGVAIAFGAEPVVRLASDSGRMVEIVGTPAYMSPEQFLAPDTVDHRSDIYSLGVTFYHAITGRLPYEGTTPRSVLMNKVQSDFTPADQLVHGLPLAVSDVLSRMMQKDPDDRFERYDELLAALRSLRLVLTDDPQSQPSTKPDRPSSIPGRARPPSPGDADTAVAGDTTRVSRAEQGARLVREAQFASKSGDKARGAELLRRATRLDRTNEKAWVWLAKLSDVPQEKYEALNRVLELKPEHEKALAALKVVSLNAGIAASRAGNRKRAQELLTHATKLDPGQELAWLWLAKVADKPSDALIALKRAQEINPHNERTRAGLEWYQAQVNAEPPCPLCLTPSARGTASCPACGALLTFADLPVWQARLPVAADRLQRAAARFETVLLKRPDAATHLNSALVFLNGKMFDRAAHHLRAALQRDEREPTKQCEPETRRLAETLLWQMEEAPSSGKTERPAGLQGTILIVDDSPTVRKVVVKALKEYGYRVVEASDGSAALACLQEERPDLVLLDIFMPGLDGYQVCRKIREQKEFVNLPVILLPEGERFSDRLRGRWAGASDYLPKPFHPEVLVQIIAKHCSRK
jgi:serine/threonine protein kinase/CheY-like chemotaxis protein